ncbi:TolC family protein [Sulfurimonas sp.]|uniref:TolC family protein n=1 Tax=Sulfurimonas sp. TaxID=2022749 RepID=UPI0025FF8DE0|nr:TolC family protein [Sulfurimonas sp.]MBW6488203.1 TolC family protein [Sulfurimonas sp.]
MRTFFLLLLPVLIFADDLRSILDAAHQNNDLLLSSKFKKEAKEREVESKKSDFFPTVDIGASYQNTSDTTLFQIRDIYAGYGKIEMDIYDGGIKSSLLSKTKDEFRGAVHDEEQMKKSLSLQIVQDFYNIKSLESSLRAKEDAGKSLQEQLGRIKQFYDAKLATQDDIERLQASYDNNLYEIEALSFEMLSVKKSLELKVGKEIESFDASGFKEAELFDLEPSDEIKSLTYKVSAMKNSAEALEGAYYPNVKLEDKYTIYGYDDIAPNHPAKIDRQNVLMLSLNMRIFDYSSTSESKQALMLNSKALSQEISYMSKEQKMRHEISVARVKSSKLKIRSAKSALNAAFSAFAIINEKYNAGIVDYVIYLDALSAKTDASALYEKSLNDLEVAYAMFYYYGGKKLKDFIK